MEVRVGSGWCKVISRSRANTLDPKPLACMQQAGSHAAVADLGGSIITGIDGNPLAVLSSQLGIPMHTIGPDCDLLLPDGSKASKAIDNQVRG